jgi:nucleotide-binding universal stress UspA family protein
MGAPDLLSDMHEVQFRQITVPIDGSPDSDRALRMAIDLAIKYGASIQLVTVLPTFPTTVASAGYIPPDVAEQEAGYYRGVLRAGEERARSAGVLSVSAEFLEGGILETILDFVERHPTDLVVVGSRGLGLGRRVVLGSISEGLIRHLHTPVLVVRPPATTP